MRVQSLSVLLMAVTVFGLSTALEPRLQQWEGDRHASDNLLQAALGDGRKLFAKHFYSKADVYFHNGYYPTIYDADSFKKGCIADGAHTEADEEREDFLGKSQDWIDSFSRNFFPARHTHLGESGCGHSCCQRRKDDSNAAAGHNQAPGHEAHDGHDDRDHDHDHDHHAGPADTGKLVAHCDQCGHDHSDPTSSSSGAQAEREILPWLRLSADLDPERVETYVVASFWLRNKLGKVDEAEQFLREGLQANPGDYEILFELGSIYYENRKDVTRARNVWELALKRWQERESGKQDPPLFVYGSILNNLAMLEREQHNYPRAIKYYAALKEISPNPASIQSWIDYLATNGPPIKVGLSAP